MNTYLPATKKEYKSLLKEAFMEIAENEFPQMIRKGTRKRYLNTEEAMELLGCSRKHLYYLRSEKKLPFIKEGKKIYYDIEDIEAFMEKHKVKPLEASHEE